MLWLFTKILSSIPDCIGYADIVFVSAICIVLIAIGFLNNISKGGN